MRFQGHIKGCMHNETTLFIYIIEYYYREISSAVVTTYIFYALTMTIYTVLKYAKVYDFRINASIKQHVIFIILHI